MNNYSYVIFSSLVVSPGIPGSIQKVTTGNSHNSYWFTMKKTQIKFYSDNIVTK